MMVPSRVRRGVAASAAVLLAACADPEAPLPTPSEVVLVVNSIESSLSVVPVDATGSTYTIPLGGTTPTPVGVSALGAWAIVPMGLDHAVTVVDLTTGTVSRVIPAGQRLRTQRDRPWWTTRSPTWRIPASTP